jgi:hypothetical protein
MDVGEMSAGSTSRLIFENLQVYNRFVMATIAQK